MAELLEDTIGGRRARAKAANRAAILDAARNVFARNGYEATTIRDIIRETELASGTFYNYFRSKEEVFEALSDRSTRRFRDVLADVRAGTHDFESYIRAAFRAYFAFLRDEQEDACKDSAQRHLLAGIRVDTPEMLAVIDEVRADLERHFETGQLPALDTGYLTAAAVGMAREIGDFILRRDLPDIDEAAEFASRLLLAGVGALAVPDSPD